MVSAESEEATTSDTDLMTAAENLHQRRAEYRLARARLDRAIAEAEWSYERLVVRLAAVDRQATWTGERLRRPQDLLVAPAARETRRQRSSTTISVAHATAS